MLHFAATAEFLPKSFALKAINLSAALHDYTIRHYAVVQEQINPHETLVADRGDLG